MKRSALFLSAAAAYVLAAAVSFAQDVVPAVSLGDPIPNFQADPNIIPVSGGFLSGVIGGGHSGGSCNGCKLDIQPCQNPHGCKDLVVSVPCPGGCDKAPSCATCAKPAPCKACDIVKLAPRIHTHAPACNTCSAPKPAPAPACSACTTPARVPDACNLCETKKHHHRLNFSLSNPFASACKSCSAPAPDCDTCAAKPVAIHRPAPCTTCSAPAAKPCDSGCKAAPTCDACAAGDPCKAHKHHTSRPILDALTNLFKGHGHSAPAASTCSSCSTCSATSPVTATPVAMSQPVQQIPSHAVPMTPVPTAHEIPAQQNLMPVPAALAPYTPPVPFSTATPPPAVYPQR